MASIPRRDFLLGLGAALAVTGRTAAQETYAQADGAERMADPPAEPFRARPQRDRLYTTPYDNDPFVVAVESKLKCTCSCLHNVYECRSVDFSCSLWPEHHADIVGQATRGWTAQQIIDQYVSDHGAEFLMAPAARGFNLIAYLLPGALIALVGGGLAVLLGRSNKSRLLAAAATPGPVDPLADDAARRLQEELDRLDA